MWTVKLSRQAAGILKGLKGKHRTQLENGLDELSSKPHNGKMLKGELKGYWSFRVGAYRIIYVIRNKEVIVEVLRIHHRKEVYERIGRI
jgi:mRNA interferase RelE/StbE